MQKIVLVKRCLGNNAVICKFFMSEASLYINIYWDRYCIFGAGNWLFELGGGYRLSVAACSLSLALVYFLFVLFKLSTDLLKDLVKPPLFSFHLEKKRENELDLCNIHDQSPSPSLSCSLAMKKDYLNCRQPKIVFCLLFHLDHRLKTNTPSTLWPSKQCTTDGVTDITVSFVMTAFIFIAFWFVQWEFLQKS